MMRAAVGQTVESALSARWESVPDFAKMPRCFFAENAAGAGTGKSAALCAHSSGAGGAPSLFARINAGADFACMGVFAARWNVSIYCKMLKIAYKYNGICGHLSTCRRELERLCFASEI